MTQGESRDWLYFRRTPTGALDRRGATPTAAVTVSVAVVDPAYGLVGPTTVTPLLKQLLDLSVGATDVDAVVLRGISLDSSEPSAREIAEALHQKWGRRVGLGMLLREPGSRALRYVHAAGPRYGLEELLPQFRHVELRTQIERAGALYRPDHAHIVLPSGWHADAYVRVADAFDDYTAISRIADWLDHRVDPNTILVSDTWTILPLLQELSQRAGAETSTGRAPVMSFAEYPDADEVRATLRAIEPLTLGRAAARVLFILSAASSGGLVENLRRLCERYIPDVELEVVAIANTDPAHVRVESLCFIEGIERFDAGHCELCANGDIARTIEIDRKRYFPKLLPHREPRTITSEFARAHAGFWELVSRTDAVRLHAYVPEAIRVGQLGAGADPAGVSHREIAIDAVALLSDRKFERQLRDKLATFAARTDLVLVPRHHATSMLLTQARAVYPAFEYVIVQDGWVAELRQKLAGVRRILILDDAVVSGHTVRAIHRILQHEIHDLPSHARPDDTYEIRAFAVICRPHSERQLARLRDSLRQRGAATFLDYGYSLFLPDQGCTWCDERGRLRRLRTQLVSAPHLGPGTSPDHAQWLIELLGSRLELLSPIQSPQKITGLVNAIFLCDRDGRVASETGDTLTRNSLFGQDLGEAAAFGAVTAAMHSIRLVANEQTQRQQSTFWEWDLARIVSLYHDPILQASFIRASRAEELRVAYSEDLERAMLVALPVGDPTRHVSPMLATEHLWAALTHKYPLRLRPFLLSRVHEVLEDWISRTADPRYAELEEFAAALTRQLTLPADLREEETHY